MVPVSEAIPNWTGCFGNSQETSALYDSVDTGSAAIAILDANSLVPGLIPGNIYTVVLQVGGSSGGYVSASISQTALIPQTAKSILFDASVPFAAGWQVTIDGQNVPVSQISIINVNFAVYAGNVSAYAGQVDNLQFSALSGAGPTVNLYLDAISFSSSSVPEPSVCGLLILGSLIFCLRRRHNSSP